MEGFGQFGPILVRPGHQISGTFTLNKITNLDRNTRPCISNENYSYNQCLRKYAVKVSSCNIDLPQKQYNCTENGLKLLFRTLTELRSRTKTNITKTTGCLPKCVINKYVFDQKENEIVTWRKDWISSFYLTSETTTYQTSLESYSYEIQVIGNRLSQMCFQNDVCRMLLVQLVDILDCFWAGLSCQYSQLLQCGAD